MTDIQLKVDQLTASQKARLLIFLGLAEKPKRKARGKNKTQVAQIIEATRHVVALRGCLDLVKQVHFCNGQVMATDLAAYLTLPIDTGVTGSVWFTTLRGYKKGNVTTAEVTGMVLDTGGIVPLAELDPETLPLIPAIEDPVWQGKLTREDIDMLAVIAPVAATDLDRPILTALYLEVNDDSLKVTAADGYELFHRDMLVTSLGGGGETTFLLPARYTRAMQDIGKEGLEVVIGSTADEYQYIKFTAPNGTTLVIRGEAGRYVDYTAVIPSEANAQWTGNIPTEFILDIAKTLPQTSPEDHPWYAVKVTADGETLTVEHGTGQQWQATSPGSTGQVYTTVNWTYMGKVAKAAEVDSLTMTIQEKGRAIKLSAPNCLGVVMPMKVDR